MILILSTSVRKVFVKWAKTASFEVLSIMTGFVSYASDYYDRKKRWYSVLLMACTTFQWFLRCWPAWEAFLSVSADSADSLTSNINGNICGLGWLPK